MPGQVEAIRCPELHAVLAVGVVQRGDFRLFQQADQAPGAFVVAEQPFIGQHTDPQQTRARMLAEARPAKALPAFLLVEVLMLFAVEDESGLHHVAHRLAAQLETQAHAAVGVEHVGEVAELVDRRQELRVEVQTLAVPRVGHPAAALLAHHATQLLLQKLFDAPGVGADHLPQHRQRGIAAGGGKGVATGEGAVPVLDDRPLPLAVEARR
ncbi:hypothetical protein D3C85_1254240 [compost metagenome]